MSSPRSSLLAPVVLVFLLPSLSPGAEASLEVPHGFASRNRFLFDATADFPLQLGALTFSPDGRPIVYENGQIRLHLGETERVLAAFDPPVFGSFLVVEPGGESVLFGESSSDGIFRIALAGEGATLVDRLRFNFDLAFAPAGAGEPIAGRGFLSGLGSNDVNAVWLLDEDPTNTNDEIIHGIPRFSGPLAFDPEGSLYVITSGADFSADEEFGERLVRFSPGQLAAGIGEGAVDFAEGEVLLRELDGLFNMKWHEGRLWGTNLGLSSGVGSVDVIDLGDDLFYWVFATVRIGEGSGNPSFLAIHPGSKAFEAGAGAAGGRMLVAYGNFFDTSNVAEVVPELWFVRGETNGAEPVDISDARFLLDFLFLGGPSPDPVQAADVNADGARDVSDAVYLLNFLFLGGPEPPAPFPMPGP